MKPLDLAVVDHLLTTTRSVRKRLDLSRPVPLDVIERCIEIAIQAPTGSNAQNWHFLVVTDAEKREQLANLYRQAFSLYRQMNVNAPQLREGDPRREQTLRIVESATYLADHLHEVPVHVVPCIDGRAEQGPVVMQASLYGSILPAVWSLMLALRSRGLGSAWTTLHLMYEKEAAAVLGIPEHVTQVALLPVAYFTGEDFKPAKRLPVRNFISLNSWGTPLPERAG
ncbi:MAG: nitroreductase family protein [Candidatus Binatia bacterium]|nr:nitroreductase family protein [Candidatus Binatia bacterium]